MTATPAQAGAGSLRCRPCRVEDAPAIVDLLHRGFPERPLAYWERGMARLCRHAAALGAASFGQALEAGGRVVGVLLLIPSRDAVAGGARCNVSSWYVDPDFRSFAAMLLSRGGRERDVTFFNISPAVHTRPIIEAQGFQRYGTGRFWALPWLARPRRAGVTRLATPAAVAARFAGDEGALLADHLAWGCLVLAADTPSGPEPFVFLPRLTKGVVPSVQLVFCRDVLRFVELAGPVGRWLLRHGYPVAAIDSDGPIPGLPGRFAGDDLPKYFKGPVRPRVGDLSYSELLVFGP